MVPECLAGWTQHTNKCYKFFSAKKQWTEARNECQVQVQVSASWKSGYKGDLASVPDMATNNFLASLESTEEAWIGATDAKNEGHWRWSDGTRMSFTNWADGEPNNHYHGKEDYALTNYHGITGRWNDFSNDNGNGKSFFCQYILYPRDNSQFL